jgi:hypothetical protein
VITSTYAAEWARNGGGVVNAVTKSGTRRFSGSAYEFLRNDALNANSFFRNMDPRPEINGAPPRVRYNNFGYTLGGPALPARKKLFFFFSQEWRRNRREKRSAQGAVPDPTWLTDPGNPNYVPPEARDPNALKLLTLWPAPNVPGTNRYVATIGNEFDTRQEFVRADGALPANWAITGRYLHDRVDSRGEYVTSPDRTAGHRYQVGHLAVVEAKRAAGRLLHDVSYQLSSHTQSAADALPTRDAVAVVIPELFPENAANLTPSVSVTGLSSITASQPRPREYRNQTFSSTISLQQGSHTLKAGGLFAIEHANSNLFPESTQGAFQFQAGGGFTAFQNFLRGNAGSACGPGCSYFEIDIDVVNRFRTRRYEAFIQDTWRVDNELTLDVGLRYAYSTPLIDEGDRLFTFSPDAYDPAQAPPFADPDGWFVMLGSGDLFNGIRVAGQDSPHGRALHAADSNNLQPRIGAAWDPTGAGRLFLRAGYGLYFDQTQAGMFAQNVQESYYDPFRTGRVVSNAPLSNPAAGQVIEPDAVETPVALATSDRFVAPRWQHWNIGLQRRLYSRGVIDAGYVGSRGDHLIRYMNINKPSLAAFAAQPDQPNLARPFQGYGAIIMRETTARSQYHGFLASFRHEAGRAGSVTLNYTFSRNEADATYDNSPLDDPQDPSDIAAEFAEAGTDRLHIFNAIWMYELPFARSGTPGWRQTLMAGWQIAGITRIESGPAARVQAGNCNYDGWCFPGLLRPDQVGDPSAGNQGTTWFDPAAFVPSPAGEYGDAPVAPFRLPGRHQWDVAVSKHFTIRRTMRLQVRADLINAFNQTQFLDVNTQCVGTTSCDPRAFGQVTTARPPREIQLGIRFDW